MFVSLPPDVCFIGLNYSAQETAASAATLVVVIMVIAASSTKPLQHEPRRLLRYADFLGKLQRRDTLTGRDDKVNGVQPLVQGNVRPLEDGPGTNSEVIPASEATKVARYLADLYAMLFTAMRTYRFASPTPLFNVFAGRVLIRETLKKTRRC